MDTIPHPHESRLPPVPHHHAPYTAPHHLPSFCSVSSLASKIVTSRQHAIEAQTRAWVDDNFPQLFSAVHFGNHFALEGASRTKSEICHEIGAQVLIDDNPGYALECAEAGIIVLLYDWRDAYPWSNGAEQRSLLDAYPNVRRVTSWAEVEAELLRLREEGRIGTPSVTEVGGMSIY